MLRYLMRSGPRLSRGVLRLLAALGACGYVLAFIAGKSLLPAFLFRDADKIQAQMDGASTYDGSSFDAVGKFYAMFGPTLLNLFVMAIGVMFLCALLSRVKHAGALCIALLFGVPCVFFNLFVASKDTLVVAMSLLIVWSLRRARLRMTASLALAGYVAYALLVRRYFLLILVAAVGAALFHRAALRARLMMIGVLILGLFLLPSGAYVALLGARDMAVDYLMYQSPYGARTAFYNPLPPTSLGAFCVDYLHAVLRLHAPVLFSPDPRGVAMQAFVMAVCGAARSGARAARSDPGAGVLAFLLAGHMIVSMLFEPDLGSYVRHLSSVALFCMVLASDRRQASQGVRGCAR